MPIWQGKIDSKTELTLQEFSEKLANAVRYSTIEDELQASRAAKRTLDLFSQCMTLVLFIALNLLALSGWQTRASQSLKALKS